MFFFFFQLKFIFLSIKIDWLHDVFIFENELENLKINYFFEIEFFV